MAATTVKIGYGAEFHFHDGTSLFQAAEVTSIGMPNPQMATVDATHMASDGRAHEYIPGLVDYGEIAIGMNFIAGSSTDTKITSSLAAGAIRAMKIVIPTATDADGWGYSFNGIFTGYEKDIPLEDRQTATVTVRITGPVTEAAET